VDFIKSRKQIFCIPIGITIVSLFIFSLAVIFQWMGTPATYGMKFCEAGYNGLFKQPVNTFSNIGFIIVGISIAWSQAKGRYAQNNNIITRSIFFPTFYASLVVILAPGSMALHATTTRVGGVLDLLSMYLIASFVFSYALTRLFKWKSIGFTLTFIAALSTQLYVQTLPYDIPFFGVIGSFCFGVFLILTGIIELFSFWIRKVQMDIKYGIASILVMFIATFIWKMSLTDGPWCDQSSLIQGHGFWHLLNATSIYFLYRFYVSENLISKKLKV
jgi:hypothetical protein